jgi:nucleoside-diphosphate-sugar epimerase
MKDDRQSFISWWIRQLIENNEIKVFGDGTQIRSLNYIDDVVNAFLIAAANETTNGMTYNLGSKHPIALKNLAQMLIDVYKGGIFDLIPFPKDREQIDIGSIHTSYDKINKALGWEEETPLRKGLARTIQYYTKYKSKYW